MKFSKFPKIYNYYDSKKIESAEEVASDSLFIIQEKIHGANFSFWCDGNEVLPAKRSGFIGAGENFYSYKRVFENYAQAVGNMFHSLGLKNGDVLVVYGELFGGLWPDSSAYTKEMPKDKQVQRGVYYSPWNEFAAFDVAINGELLECLIARDACLRVGVPFVPIFTSRNTLNEALEYETEGVNSVVPFLFGLPQNFEIGENEIEGIVIKTNRPVYNEFGERVVFKKKNTKFAEKEKKTSAVKVALSEHIQSVIDCALEYVNENRLRAVLSKREDFEMSHFGETLKEFSIDVIEDFSNENTEYHALDKNEQKLVTKAITQGCSRLMKENIVAMCGNDL